MSGSVDEMIAAGVFILREQPDGALGDPVTMTVSDVFAAIGPEPVFELTAEGLLYLARDPVGPLS